ncbi:MAG: hypothetical protein ACYCST_15915 [Acidimicrobiales bacterium]
MHTALVRKHQDNDTYAGLVTTRDAALEASDLVCRSLRASVLAEVPGVRRAAVRTRSV